MRLGGKRCHAPGWWRRKHKSVSGGLVLLLIVTLLAGGTACVLSSLRPVLAAVAESQAQHIATMIANETIRDVLAEQGITYQDLVTLQTGTDGKISAIQSNVVAINALKADVAIGIQERITAEPNNTVSIPLGSLLGTDILAGMGPNIHVELMPVGAVTVELRDSFTEAGINQTRHAISMEVAVQMMLFMPTIQKDVTIVTQAPIAQTIIVGETPGSYVNVGEGLDEQTEERVLQMAPNGTGGQ